MSKRNKKRAFKTNGCGHWPNYNDNLGVSTHQVQEAIAYSRKIGVPTEFCPKTGCAIFTSAKHRKKYAEAMGYKVVGKRGAGYSDPVSLSQRERENKGYFDENRMTFIGNQQKFSENWTKIDWGNNGKESEASNVHATLAK